MSLLKLSKTLSTCNLPDKNLTTLAARGKHLTVPGKVIDTGAVEVGVQVKPGECKAEDGVLHQHEVLRGLVFQVLPDLSSGEVPHLLKRIEMLKPNQKAFHLDESVHTA